MSSIDQAYRHFCTRRFPLPTAQAIADLENRINVAFPPHYRRFLLEYNGGWFSEPDISPPVDECPVDGLMYMHGVDTGEEDESVEVGSRFNLTLWDDNDPPIIVPIGYTTMGNLIILIVATDGDDYGDIALATPSETYHLDEHIEDFFSRLRPVID